MVVESAYSDRLWLSFSLAFAKPNKRSNKCPKCTVEVTFIQIEDVVELEVRI